MKPGVGKRHESKVSVALLLLDPATNAVDPALDAGAPEVLEQISVARRGLVDEQVLPVLGPGLEDLWPQDGRHERRPGLHDRRVEEGGDEVVEAAGQLGLHDGPGELELGVVTGHDLGREVAAVHDLLVVDGEDRKSLGLREEVAPGLEVADHHLGPESLGDVEEGADVLGPSPLHERALHVGEEGAEVPHPVVLVDDGQAPDAVHAEPVGLDGLQVVVRPPRHHHLKLVLAGELVEHHPGPDGVPHSLADHSVEDAHAGSVAVLPGRSPRYIGE